MTSEDDAFMRAIASQPQDEAVWLIYADWLEERDDPRGAYLRALTEMGQPRASISGFDEAERVIRMINSDLDQIWRQQIWQLRTRSTMRGMVDDVLRLPNAGPARGQRTHVLVRLLAGQIRQGETLLLPLTDGGTLRETALTVFEFDDRDRFTRATDTFPLLGLSWVRGQLSAHSIALGGIITHAPNAESLT